MGLGDNLRILLIGSGGREHALAWKLAQSPRVSALLAAPGNPGIATETLASTGESARCVDVGAMDIDALIALAQRESIDLTVVGPDDPLAAGIVDRFQEAGLAIWGPTQEAAKFEWSKAYTQDFCQRHGIPCALGGGFEDPEAAVAFAERLEGRCAVKADGLALGKGVTVCQSMDEARRAIEDLMVDRRLGDAGGRVVIQEALEGPEMSLHALCDGDTYRVFPSAQDHKAIFDGGKGPNTGGMGVYSPTQVSESEFDSIAESILEPWLAGLKADGIRYRGLIYPGIIRTATGPKLIEFNARFGDPETQVFMVRMAGDLVDWLEACLEGGLARLPMAWRAETAVCLILASAGYPGSYRKGLPIEGLESSSGAPNLKVFHAGVQRDASGRLVTGGGRVLGVTCWAETQESAANGAYAAAESIHFEGKYFRTDIARS